MPDMPNPLAAIASLRRYDPPWNTDGTTFEATVEPDARASAVATAVVAAIRERWSLSFFDGAHPTVSDPGAYPVFYRRDGTLRAHVANHGWSSGWTDLSDADASAYLGLSRAFNQGPERLSLRTTDRLDWPGDGRSAEHFERYLAGRLEAPTGSRTA